MNLIFNSTGSELLLFASFGGLALGIVGLVLLSTAASYLLDISNSIANVQVF